MMEYVAQNSPPNNKVLTIPGKKYQHQSLWWRKTFYFILLQKSRTPPIKKRITQILSVYPVVFNKSSTNKQLENMRIDPKFVELTADVLKIFRKNVGSDSVFFFFFFFYPPADGEK